MLEEIASEIRSIHEQRRFGNSQPQVFSAHQGDGQNTKKGQFSSPFSLPILNQGWFQNENERSKP